jgi:hypothetical protein
MSYRDSEQRIFEAETAMKEGDVDRARALFREAAALQAVFVDAQPAERVKTKSVFGLSAAILFYQAGDLGAAESLARRLLAEPWILPGPAAKLEALIDRIEEDQTTGSGHVRQRLRAFGVSNARLPYRPLFHDEGS